MKVIELLNKIANGEKVPKVIYFWGREYIYDEEYNCYMHQTGANEFINLLDNDTDDSYCFLNDEVQLSRFGDVEVITGQDITINKEDKKIPGKLDERILLQRRIEDVGIPLKEMLDKINEIIDYLEEKEQ